MCYLLYLSVKVNEQHTTEDGPCPFDCSLMCQWHRLNCNYVRASTIILLLTLQNFESC